MRAKGFDVVELGLLQVNVRSDNSVQTHQIEEHLLVNKCIESQGLSLVNIKDATDSDMDLRSIEKLPLLNDALPSGGNLRFASVPDSMRRVITDSSGIKYINLRNPDVQKILKVIPQAISNPLKSRLLDAYLKLENFQFQDARSILTDLLQTNDLIPLATTQIAPFTQKHMESLITDLLGELDQ